MGLKNLLVSIIVTPNQVLPYFPSSLYSFMTTFAGSNEVKLANIVLGPVIIVLGTETVVDWVKHAFIGKFNALQPKVYGLFTSSLCRDILKEQEMPQTQQMTDLDQAETEDLKRSKEIEVDASVRVSKRMGFLTIPLACLVIRIGFQVLQILEVLPEQFFGHSTPSTWGVSSFTSSSNPIPQATITDSRRSSSAPSTGGGDGSGEDASIGSWTLPSKLTMWIISQRKSFERAGLKSSSFLKATKSVPWLFIFFVGQVA